MKRCYKLLLSLLCAAVLTGCGETEEVVELPSIQIEEEPVIEEIEEAEEAVPEQKGYLVVIDAGHQQKGNSEKEPIGPGASETKAKVTGGTTGVSTGIHEYELNLKVALMLEEIFIRIHANGAGDSGVNGAMTICQTPGNPYNGALYEQSRKLSDCVLDAFVEKTGAKKQRVWETDTMSGINWASVPTTIVEMGYMSNPAEDERMADEEYQRLMAEGIADGIDRYFTE